MQSFLNNLTEGMVLGNRGCSQLTDTGQDSLPPQEATAHIPAKKLPLTRFLL